MADQVGRRVLGSNPRGIRAACSPLIAPKVRVKAGAASSRRSRRVPGADVAAHGVQRRRVGRVQTAADPDVAWPDLEVEAGAAQPTERALRKERGDVGLQRPLVGAEPGIAPRPEQRDLGIGDEVGRHRGEVHGQPLDDGHHRPSHERLVLGAVLVKPLAAVVAGDGAQEAQRPWRKSGRLGWRDHQVARSSQMTVSRADRADRRSRDHRFIRSGQLSPRNLTAVTSITGTLGACGVEARVGSVRGAPMTTRAPPTLVPSM